MASEFSNTLPTKIWWTCFVKFGIFIECFEKNYLLFFYELFYILFQVRELSSSDAKE